jgi:hypothetical protein
MVKSKTIIIEFDFDIDSVEGNQGAFNVYSTQRVNTLEPAIETLIPVVTTQRKRGILYNHTFTQTTMLESTSTLDINGGGLSLREAGE